MEEQRILLDKLVKIEKGDGDDVELGISWDLLPNEPTVDLDVTAVLYDNTGTISDACYYSQLEIAGGAIKHSGDNKTGEGDGDDEVITLDLDALEP
jgi:stress response protein SCP2